MGLTRIDTTMDALSFDSCLWTAESLFADYLAILKAIIALHGSSDGQNLSSNSYEESLFYSYMRGVYSIPDPEDRFMKSLCQIIQKNYPLTINSGLIIDDSIPEKENNSRDVGANAKWVYTQYHFYGQNPPTTFKADQNTYFRITENDKSLYPDTNFPLSEYLYMPLVYTGVDLPSATFAIEKAYRMLVLSSGYFDFLEIFQKLLHYLLIPLQPIIAAHNERCIDLPFIVGYDAVYLPTGIAINLNASKDADKSHFPSYRELFDLIHIYEAEVFFKFRLVGNELDRRGLVNIDENQSVKKWSAIMTKELVGRKLGWSRTKLNRYLERHSGSILDFGRQNYRFDCNDPAFCSFNVDEAFNKMETNNDKN